MDRHPTPQKRRNRPLFVIAALGLLLSFSPRARAADTIAEAKEQFQRGQTHYSLGEFTEAVTAFREAYRLSNAPAILFNLGQAMRQLGNYKQAYFYYSQYLSRRPDAPNRAEVDAFMETLKKKLDADEEAEKSRAQADAARPLPPRYPEDRLEADESGASAAALKAKSGAKVAVAAPASGAVPVKAPASVPAAPGQARAELQPKEAAPADAVAMKGEPHTGIRGTKIAGYSLLGAGVIASGLAVVFHSGAQSAADELDQKYQSGTLTPADAHLKDDVSSKGQLATLSLVAAGVLVIGGALLAFVF